MKELSELIPSIHELFNSTKEHLPSQANIDKLTDGLNKALKKAFSKEYDKPEGHNKLYISSIGQPARKLWYQARDKSPRSDNITPTQSLNFLYGNLVEEMFLFLIREAGYEVTDEQKRVEIEGVSGKLDCKINGVPIDIKSASNTGFDKFKDSTIFEDDPYGYLGQISAYAECEGASEGGLFAFNKENGELSLLPLNKLDLVPVVPLIRKLKADIASEVIPPKCYPDEPEGEAGNMKLGKNCRYCVYKHRCWEGLRTFEYAKGKKVYLTKVVKLPRVPEITGG